MSETGNIVPLFTLGLPLLAFFALWLAGPGINRIAGWIGASVTLTGFIILSWFLLTSEGVATLGFDWITIGDFNLSLTFHIDNPAWLLLLIVHFIATLVQVYSAAYLHDDQGRYRYFAFLQLFLFSMNGIIMAGSLIVMYIFWEMVGLCSYLLIGFWRHKPRASWAAQKAMILNRVGDAAFLTGILLLFFHVGDSEFSSLPLAVSTLSSETLTLIGLCLFGGCAGKSAQFPLSAWLPDAMEGPTPVSALIHAATMVAAGIFLLARISILLTPTAQAVIIVIGVITMLHGAIKALNTWDVKGVLAYSTMSQLGLMVIAAGTGSWQAALFHLTTHAFFKAGLFLAAGSVIHAMTPLHGQSTSFDPQDMRNMGGLKKQMPFTFICFTILSAALAGVPFLSGFLSKDTIFLEAFGWAAQKGGIAWSVPVLAVAAAGLTAFYMFRQIYLVFFGPQRYDHHEVRPHESPIAMWLPMAILSGLSLFFVFSLNPFDASGGWFNDFIPGGGDTHNSWVPIISVVVTIASAFIAWRYAKQHGFTKPVNQLDIRYPLLADFHADHHTRTFFLIPFQQISVLFEQIEARILDAAINGVAKFTVIFAHLVSWGDRRVVDGSVNLLVSTIRTAGKGVKNLQSGQIQSYYIVTGLSLFLLIIWWMSI